MNPDFNLKDCIRDIDGFHDNGLLCAVSNGFEAVRDHIHPDFVKSDGARAQAKLPDRAAHDGRRDRTNARHSDPLSEFYV